MDPERWRRIEALYHGALEVASSERTAYLAEHCNGDPELRREVESLLKQERARALLDGSISQAAAELLEEDAPLPAGTQLGPYRIEKLLGTGGMGRVYRARDTRLNRTVAIKISKDEFSERFEREARAVAALNHPNICQLYDIGPNFLVMELVDGSRLRGPVALGKAVEYASQILDALDAAHRKNLVHRDLKPANIMVSRQGIKLLDFGLAKQTGAANGEATLTAGLTGAGAIVGTLQYMSPEQLQGKAVDARSDLFAFGCVLYELLAGKRAFEGENPASVIASVLERDPASIEISPPLDRVVKRCLAKDPDQRFQTASDLKIALKWAAEQTTIEPPATRRWMTAAAALAVCTTGLAVALWAPWRKPAPEPPSYTFNLEPAEGDAASGPFSLSRDGRMIQVRAFDSHGQGLMMFRRLDSFEWRRLPIAEVTGRTCWSPDGREIAFTTRSKVQKMDVATGAVQTLTDYTTGGPPFVGWSRTGMIVFSRRTGLWKIPASGGEPAQLTRMDEKREEIWHHISDFLPDGRHFLYLAGSRQQAKSAIYLGLIDAPPANNRRFILSSSTGVLYAPGPHGTGYLLFEREGALMAQPFDTSRYRLTGEPFMVLPQIRIAGSFPTISVSETGVLAYATGRGNYLNTQLAWFSRKGDRIADVGPPGRYGSFSLSRDGARVALHRYERDDSNVWILYLSRNRFTRLTLDEGASPVWSPDGREVAYIKQRSGQTVYRKPVDGAGEEQPLGGPLSGLLDWTRSGQILGHRMLGVLAVLADGRVTPLLPASDASAGWGQMSPDGKWIAYASDESKRQSEIYVQSYPLKAAKYQISTAGGVVPHWRADGQELYYVALDNKLMAVPVKTGAAFEFGTPVPLFQPPVPQSPGSSGYAVSPDGQRFLFRTMTAGYRAAAITIMTNWLSAVKH